MLGYGWQGYHDLLLICTTTASELWDALNVLYKEKEF